MLRQRISAITEELLIEAGPNCSLFISNQAMDNTGFRSQPNVVIQGKIFFFLFSKSKGTFFDDIGYTLLNNEKQRMENFLFQAA